MKAQPQAAADAIAAGDWVLHAERSGCYEAPPSEWSLDRVVFVTPEYVVVTYTHLWRGHASPRLQIILRREIRAFGSKALVARFRAACTRKFAPFAADVQKVQDDARAVSLKACNAVQKMRAKSRLAPAKAR
jgi:hypothetical protein